MDLFKMRDFDAHEQVTFGCDAASGLHAIIAIHSTALGPAAGGCRMWPYPAFADAVADALRLSRGMSYKNAMANLPFGGGKAVIIGDSREKTRQRMEAFGRLVDSLGGRYITAEDVGTTTTDMEHVARMTSFVSGLVRGTEAVPPAAHGGGARGPGIVSGRSSLCDSPVGGDPGPKTALGVFLGLKAAVRFRLGRGSLEGLKIAVQGLGGVGAPLCRLLAAEGASLVVADSRAGAARRVCEELGAVEVPAASILSQDVDVLAPCALGAILDSRSIPGLRARVIAGAANNQLARDEDGEALMRAGILYAPDYVINAGGIISVAHEYRGGAGWAQVKAEIDRIPARLTEIFERAHREERPTSAVADEMARERLANGARRKVA
ncbi:MAG TPA: Glu/Leu/Phe/Val dehydrogenase dimerization domain-containing protein [Steroidobacteraceae bacterium]|nr:Glu/Leu/Phe/Val dehydrogenase dimerization domain-containing protein [Steroidobacteraceae bacterium]